MLKINPVKKFYLSLLRNAEGGGGGEAGGGSSGVVAVEGEVAPVADSAAPPPAATFLTEAGKPAEGEAAPDGEAPLAEEKPVEALEAFDVAALTLPEGFELPEEMGKSFTDLLSDDKLSPQERGQKLVDLHASTLKEASTKIAEQMTQANMDLWTKTNEEWRGQIKALPEFKDNPDAEAGKIMQALTSVGAGEDFFKALDLTGAGNHPAILQVLHRLTKPFMEGGAVQGQGGTKPARQLGANIYTSTRT